MTFDRLVMGLVALALAAMTAVLMRSGNRQALNERRIAVGGRPQRVTDWERLSGEARTLAPGSGMVTVLEFSDFECPFCRKFNSTMLAVQKRYPGMITRKFMHFPLSNHRFALAAAHAAECAAMVGRFAPYHDLLFAKQDSLGVKPWTSFAAEAGVTDTAAFGDCARSGGPDAAVSLGLNEARRLSLDGTPTVMVNGWQYPEPPSESTLVSAVEAALHSRSQQRGSR